MSGWDEGIVQTDGGMTLGEKSTLLITGYVTLHRVPGALH